MNKLINGMDHVCLKCSDMEEYDKVNKFYGEVLGLPVRRTWGTEAEPAVMFELGNSGIEVFCDAESTLDQGAVRHFALATDDVDACVKAVAEAGYDITRGPEDLVINSNPEVPVRIAFCIGPVGEEIEFFQEK